MIVRKIINFFLKLFRRKKPSYNKDIQGSHDCALRALHMVCPDISIESMQHSFNICCNNWPYAGITNKEFNISISNLKIKDRFQYYDNDNIILKHLLRNKEHIFIALIYGHYTVIYKGKATEYSSPYEEIYCYWQLIE